MNTCTIFEGSELAPNFLKAAEDAEALEEAADQIRRNQELAQNIDQYLDFNDDTIEQVPGERGDLPRYDSEVQRLHNEVTARANEVAYYKKLLDEESRQCEFKVGELQKRLMTTEAEKERAIMARNQEHELLVDCKKAISEAKSREDQLKLRLSASDDKCSQLEIQLQQTNMMFSDLQHKFNELELDFSKKTDSRADRAVKQIQDRSRAQTDLMQNQIDQLTYKLEEKEKSLKHLTACYSEMQRSREALQIEKDDRIHQLLEKLENSQKQLLNNPDLVENNMKLQRQLAALKDENSELERTVRNLSAKLDSTTKELQLVESMIHEMDLNGSATQKLTFTRANLAESTPLPEKGQNLHDELARALQTNKSKRDEVKSLEADAATKQSEIARLKQLENQMLIEVTDLKELNLRQSNKIQFLTEDLEKLKAKASTVQELEEMNKQLRVQLDEAGSDQERMKNVYIQLSAEKDNAVREVQRLQQANSGECSYSLKASHLTDFSLSKEPKTCEKCQENRANLNKIEVENLQLQSSISNYLVEINDLKGQIGNHKAQLEELNSKIGK